MPVLTTEYFKQITVFQMADYYILIGKYHCIETDDTNAVGAATEALKQYNEQEGTKYELKNVTKAELRIYPERKYKVTFNADSDPPLIGSAIKCEALVFQSSKLKWSVQNVTCHSNC